MNKFAAVLLAALAGCSLTPDYQRPAAPVPSAWQGNAGGARSVVSTDWQHYFPDPRLQKLIAIALENNRDLRIATARIGEARAQYGLQQAASLPNPNLTAGSNTSQTPAGASAFSSNAIHSQRYDAGISLVSFELDFWGRIASMSAAARANYLATEAAQSAFSLSLIADVANAYLSLLEIAERTRLATDTASTRSVSRELISRRRDLGISSDLDFLLADGAYKAALAERASLERQQAAAVNLLDLLAGQSVAETKDLPAPRSLEGQEITPDLIAGIPAEVLLQRPDVLAAEQRLIAANANIGAARAAFLPRIALTGSAGTASRNLSGLFGAGSGAWSFQPVLSLPLFDDAATANADIAEARRVIAVAEYEKTIQQAFREVADLLIAREKLAEQLLAQQDNAKAQSQRLRLVEARHAAGIANYLEVLDAQRESFAAQQGVLQVRRILLSSAAQLFKALGGKGNALREAAR